MQPYGKGSVQIGGLNINNPLQLSKTAAYKPQPAPDITQMFKAAGGVVNRRATGVADTSWMNKPTQASTAYQNNSQNGGYNNAYGNNSAPPAPVDPFAKWGGKSAFDQLNVDYGKTKGQTFGSITDAQKNAGSKYNSSILDTVYNLKTGQTKLDNQGTQNELAKSQGYSGILDTVGRGIRGGGVMLANRNAGTSSASEALARSWSDFGMRENNGLNNQYEQAQNSLAGDQTAFDDSMNENYRKLGESKVDYVNSIVNDAVTRLSELNSKAVSAQLPDRIDIEAEKTRIRNETLAALTEYDATLKTGKDNNKKKDNGWAKGEAARLKNAGVTSSNPFDFTSQLPGQFNNTGPFPTENPVFASQQVKKEEDK